jgi:cytochrome c553
MIIIVKNKIIQGDNMNKIILSTVLAFFLVGCSDSDVQEKKEATKVEVSKAKERVVSAPKEEVQHSEQAVTKTPQEKVKQVLQEAKKLANKEVEAPAVEEVPKEIATVTTSSNAKALFTKCAGCHGMQGEKRALAKSQIIKGWDAAKVQHALKGYKDGTYGGASKNLMKSQVANLSDADINALAEYISTL